MKTQAQVLSDETIVILLTDSEAFAKAPLEAKAFIAKRLRDCPDLLLQVHDISLVLIPLIESKVEQEAKKPNEFLLRVSYFWNETLEGDRTPLFALFCLLCLIILWTILLGVFLLILKSIGSFFFWLIFH